MGRGSHQARSRRTGTQFVESGCVDSKHDTTRTELPRRASFRPKRAGADHSCTDSPVLCMCHRLRRGLLSVCGRLRSDARVVDYLFPRGCVATTHVDPCEAKSDGHLLPRGGLRAAQPCQNPHAVERRECLHALALGLKARCDRHGVDCFEVIDR